MNNHLSSRMMVGAAIVGLVGAAGMFIYEQIYAEKRRAMLVREVARLDRQVTSMRTEMESLRELQKESHLRRVKSKKRRAPRPAPAGDLPDHSAASDSEYFTDYQSVVGTDGEMDSEEFYDVHTDDDDDDDDTLRDSVKNGVLKNVFDDDLSDKRDSSDSPKNTTNSS